MNEHDDEKYMRRCLQLASCGRLNAKPNPMVGAVIVSPPTSKIIGEGYHVRCGEGHAEVNAFASVRPEDEGLLGESTMYVSLEPCSHYGKTPPCADLIIRKGIRRVVVGCIDDFSEVQGRGVKKLRDAGIDVTVGVLEDECRWLNRRFFTFHREHRPYIILKWAQTANCFIDDNGKALAISTPFTQMLSHKLRAEEDAILVGRVTDEREHPQLSVRHWVGLDPKRLVLSRHISSGFGADSNVFRRAGGQIQEYVPTRMLMEDLYHQNIQSLIVEGGRKTLDSFLAHDLWDEIRVETNTLLTVTDGTPAPQLPPSAKLLSTLHYDSNTISRFRREK